MDADTDQLDDGHDGAQARELTALEIAALAESFQICSNFFMWRKGERKLERQWMPWGSIHPVHRAIRTGDGWLYAWAMQACTPYPMIARKTGITVQRLLALEAGAAPTGPECEALAKLWRCPLDDMLASMALEGDVRGDR